MDMGDGMDIDQDFSQFGNVCRLFPLAGVVLFPHAVLPLHIFEPRYRQMTRDALAGDRLVSVVQALPRSGDPDPQRPTIESIGCLGKILLHEELPDGRFNFLLLGCVRVRLTREFAEDGTLYRQADASIVEDEGPTDDRIGKASAAMLIERFLSLSEKGPPVDPDLAALLTGDLPLGVLTDILAHALVLPPQVKQSLLDECRVDRRAAALSKLLQTLQGATPGPSSGGGRRPYPQPFSDN